MRLSMWHALTLHSRCSHDTTQDTNLSRLVPGYSYHPGPMKGSPRSGIRVGATVSLSRAQGETRGVRPTVLATTHRSRFSLTTPPKSAIRNGSNQTQWLITATFRDPRCGSIKARAAG